MSATQADKAFELRNALREIGEHYRSRLADSNSVISLFDKGETRNPEQATQARFDKIDFEGFAPIALAANFALNRNWPTKIEIAKLRNNFDLPDELKLLKGESPARDDVYRLSMEILRALEDQNLQKLEELIQNKRSGILTSGDIAELKQKKAEDIRGREEEQGCDSNPWGRATLPSKYK